MTKDDIQTKGKEVAETIKRDLKALLDHKFNRGNRIQRRFREGLKAGKVNSFSDLHDYMDANVLGDYELVLGMEISEEDAVAIQTNDRITPQEAIMQTKYDILNQAQNITDAWIKEGGLKQ